MVNLSFAFITHFQEQFKVINMAVKGYISMGPQNLIYMQKDSVAECTHFTPLQGTVY